MEGPSFYCAYLGYIALNKPPTNLSVLQNPIRELYFKYRKTPASGHSANLKLIQKGVLVVLYENGSVKDELFFDFSSVTFVEAVKFLPVKTSSERKPKAVFAYADESKGAVSDKHAFLVDKTFHFLISSTHPPLVICVVRRPTGVKALDCHVFALDTVENSLHIAALIASAQTPAGHINKVDSGGEVARGKAGFERAARGDVIRTDYGDYSVYRGQHNFEKPQSQRYSEGYETQPAQWYPGSPVQSPGRNGPAGTPPGGMPSPILLTQDNFRESPSPMQQHVSGPLGQKGYGVYEQQNYGASQGSGYLRQPDLIMHARQRSGDSAEYSPHDRSFSGPDQNSAGAMRYDDVVMRNSANSRLSGGFANEGRLSGGFANEGRLSGGQVPPTNRLSAGQILPSGKISPRPGDLRTPGGYMGGPQFTQWQPEPTSPVSPLANISPRSPPAFPPNSPRDFNQGDRGGPVYSASNLESRRQVGDLNSDEHIIAGRPVAKVPPHMIGVKVLPSDFRMVKLKHQTEKRPESSDLDVYDNNKELMGKYKDLQEPSPNRTSGSQPGDGFRDFDVNKGRFDDRSKDFQSQWDDTIKHHRISGGDINGRFEDSTKQIYRHSGQGVHSSRYDDSNKNRFSSPPYGESGYPATNWSPVSKPSYEAGYNNDPHARTKNLEIENMFSNIRLDGGNSRDMYRQSRDKHVIEEGLGYLP